MKSISKSVAIYEQLQRAGALGVKDVCVTEAGCGLFHTVVSIDKLYLDHPRDVFFLVWGLPGLFVKQVVVVDGDVDPWDPYQVEYAMATTVQAKRDIEIVRGKSCGLDPSVAPSNRYSSDLIGIDATRPAEYYRREGFEFPRSNNPPEDQLRRIRERWEEYGFGH
jgi:2,5-furandicarboxylate decarboxylase 1